MAKKALNLTAAAGAGKADKRAEAARSFVKGAPDAKAKAAAEKNPKGAGRKPVRPEGVEYSRTSVDMPIERKKVLQKIAIDKGMTLMDLIIDAVNAKYPE